MVVLLKWIKYCYILAFLKHAILNVMVPPLHVILKITGISMIQNRSGPQTCPKSPIKQSKFTTTNSIVYAMLKTSYTRF